MVWKQDLAKLRQVLKESGEAEPKGPAPKPVPKPQSATPRSIEEEDSMFLLAMGQRGAAPKASVKEKVAQDGLPAAPALAPAVPPEEDFQAAMGGLKGLKPMETSPMEAAPPRNLAPVPAPPPEEEPVRVTPPEPEPVPTPEPAIPPSSGRQPERIHLAAGMAVEVDGSLDLRGHTVVDAIERFRERLQDGVFLGWRTFHVQLGAAPELQEAFLAYLGEPEAQVIARVAQAPIPMGGNQAWILYYANPSGH